LDSALKINPNQLNAQLTLQNIEPAGPGKSIDPALREIFDLARFTSGNVGLTPELVVHVASRLADAYDKEDCADCKERAREYRKRPINSPRWQRTSDPDSPR